MSIEIQNALIALHRLGVEIGRLEAALEEARNNWQVDPYLRSRRGHIYALRLDELWGFWYYRHTQYRLLVCLPREQSPN